MNGASWVSQRRGSARRARPALALGILTGLMLALVVLAIQTGAVAISWRQIVAVALAQFGAALPDDVTAQTSAVLLSIRLPRIVLGIAAGAGLGAAGAVLQGVFRNPLADPMLIGVSSGAALAVTAAIVLGGPVFARFPTIAAALTLPIAGFLGGLAATLLLYRLSTRAGRTSLTTMLLAGIAINALAFSGIGVFTTMASNEQLRNISFWNFGSLSGAGLEHVGVIATIVVIACIALVRMSPALNALLLGDREARHLGFDTQALKRNVIAWSALLAGVLVAACGVIGFVALVAPHVVRLFCGPDHRVVIPGAALLGATLLLAADLAARVVIAPAELPIGIVTALLGAPFFLWLLMRHREHLA